MVQEAKVGIRKVGDLKRLGIFRNRCCAAAATRWNPSGRLGSGSGPDGWPCSGAVCSGAVCRGSVRRVNPAVDQLCELVAVVLDHHHVAVAVHAEVGKISILDRSAQAGEPVHNLLVYLT